MYPRPFTLIALLLLTLVLHAAPAGATCPTWLAGPFDDGSAPNGANQTVRTVVNWDPDGAGPQPEWLVAGGVFTSIGGVAANHIAMRDPATGQWQPLGSGIPTSVNALAVFNGALVAGADGDNDEGTFDETIQRWNGSTWQHLSFTNTGDVLVLAVYNGALHAGGSFITQFTTGINPANHIARWNEAAGLWDELDTGTDGTVRALQVLGDLYVGGSFNLAGGTTADGVARWNGSWNRLPSEPLSGVSSFSLYNGQLVAAAVFPTSSVAAWNGSTWTGIGTSMSGGSVDALTNVSTELYAGGSFTTASGSPCNRMAKWTGSTWQPLLQGVDNTVFELIPYQGDLIVAGGFTLAGGETANRIARWDGSQWSAFGGGSVFNVLAMANVGSKLVAGGLFHQHTVNGFALNHIAAWDGVALSAFGDGMDNAVNSLKVFKYPGLFGATELIAGGAFTHASGVSANCIARWTIPATGIPSNGWEPMGAGFNQTVFTIERHNGVTYAGGAFIFSSSTVNRVAQWNETTDTWEPLGTGMNGPVNALKSFGGFLYAGGSFTTAGGVATGGLARWNGSAWNMVGGMFAGTVYALEVHNGLLIIGGDYPGLSGSPNIAEYTGTNYFALGTGGTNAAVRALKSTGGDLYVGGDFSNAGGLPSVRVARWNGTWHSVSGGPDNSVYSLGALQTETEAGGMFSTVMGTSLSSPGWARYTETGLPWVAHQPSSLTLAPGANAFFFIEPAMGYSGLTFQWLKDGVPLSNGLTGTGSSVLSANAKNLVIGNVSIPDAGGYACVVTNSCGSDTSFVATLTIAGPVDVPTTPGSMATVFEAMGPNPTHDAARLTFSLAREATVKVRVHDVAGRLVRLIDAGRQQPGRHDAIWDARANDGQRVRAGVYLVGLEIDGRPLGSKRLALIR